MSTETNTITATLNLSQLTALIAEVTAAERITKEGLSTLSRELLMFAYEHGDISPINSLMGVDSNGKHRLTPLNWRTAAMYFNNFVAFTSNYEKQVEKYVKKPSGQRPVLTFNKKSKAKYTRLLPTVTQWLSDSSNDIWVWADANIEMSDKPVDLMAMAVKAIVKAMTDDDNGGFTIGEIITAVNADEAVTVSLDSIRESLATVTTEIAEAA